MHKLDQASEVNSFPVLTSPEPVRSHPNSILPSCHNQMMPVKLPTSAMVSALVARVIGLLMKGMMQAFFPMVIFTLAVCTVQVGVGATYSTVVKKFEEHPLNSVLFNESDPTNKVPLQWKINFKTVATGPKLYIMVDEYKKKTTVPHEGGMLYLLNCTDGKYFNENYDEIPLTSPNISIPTGLDAISFENTQGAAEAVIQCPTFGKKQQSLPFFGSIPRVAGKGKCHERRDKLGCGDGRYEDKRVCLKREQHKAIELQGECVNMYKSQLYESLHLAYISETDCRFDVKFQYKINGKQDVDIIPGIVVAMEKEDRGMTVKDASGKEATILCNLTGEGGDVVATSEPKVPGKKASFDVQAISLLKSGFLVRVDCHVEGGGASTYFFIGIKSVTVECPSESGQPAMCKVPHWMDIQEPAMATIPTTGGDHTCAVTVELCFPKIEGFSMEATKKCPSMNPGATPSDSMKVEGAGSSEESGGNGGMIAGAVCTVILLGILVTAMAFFIHKRGKKRMEKAPEVSKRTPVIELPPIDDTSSDASEWDLKREREPEDGPVEKEPLGPDDTLFDIPSLVRNHYEKERDVTSTSGVSQGRGQGPGGGQSQRGASMAQSLRSARGDPSTSMTEANKW